MKYSVTFRLFLLALMIFPEVGLASSPGIGADRRNLLVDPANRVINAGPGALSDFTEWSAPENLGLAVNSSGFDRARFVTKDGCYLYLGSNRAGSGMPDINACGGSALASIDATPAHGKLRSQPLVEGCTSPVGFCTVGRASGTINGDFVFTARAFVPSDTPSVILFTGDIVFTTSRGEVRCQDAGAYNVGEIESGPGPFASLCTITGGTGEWAGATGHIRIQGTFSLPEGGDRRYEGSISR